MGDFNSGWHHNDSSTTRVAPWGESAHLSIHRPPTTPDTREHTCTFQRSLTGVNVIDHALFTAHRGIIPTLTHTITDPVWATITDHRPVIFDILINNFSDDQHYNRILPPEYKKPPPVELSLVAWNRTPDSDGNIPAPPKNIQKYQKILRKRLSAELAHPPQSLQAAADSLLHVSLASVAAAKQVSSTTRGQDGWTPIFMALKAELVATVSILFEVNKIEALHISQEDRQLLITQAIHRVTEIWSKKVRTLLTCDSIKHPMHDTTTCPTCQQKQLSLESSTRWRLCPPAAARKTAIAVLPNIRKLLHGKERTRFRYLAKQSIAKVQQLQDQGRWGRIFKTLTSTVTPYTLDTLILSNGSTTDNKHAISTITTHYFHDWFKNKVYLDFGFHIKDADVQRLLTDKDYFISEHQATRVPDKYLSIIWESLNSPRSKLSRPTREQIPVSTDMAHIIQAIPTREEYDSCLASTSNTTVGGMSGLTYSMMKAWPEELSTFVFNALLAHWAGKQTPEFWKWRWLCPKPKVSDNVQLSDLRPLVLVEVTRKLWISITINRIKALWDREQLLLQSQHAYRSKHGTDSAMIQIINAFEQARETCADLWVSSWDVKRAFDSVGRNVQIAVWLRLGVPLDIARYLALIDAEGLTVVRTPLAQEMWHKRQYNAFDTTTDWSAPLPPCNPHSCLDPPLAYPCERGTGQGDVPSTLQWNGFYDILLTALDSVKTGRFYTQSTLHHKHLPDNAFADDTLSFAADHHTLQEKANIVSAFSIVFGTDLRDDKLLLLWHRRPHPSAPGRPNRPHPRRHPPLAPKYSPHPNRW